MNLPQFSIGQYAYLGPIKVEIVDVSWSAGEGYKYRVVWGYGDQWVNEAALS